MGDGKRMRPRKAIGMFPLDHQGRLGAVEPARILEFRTVDDDVFIGGARGASDHQRRRIGPGLRHVIIHVGAANPDSSKISRRTASSMVSAASTNPARQEYIPGRKLLLPAQQAFVARGHQHDHDGIGARKMLGLAVRAIALPAALRHRRAGAAIGAKTVALMPAHHRFRHRDRRKLVGRHHALHRHAAQFADRDVVAGQQFLHGGRADAHAEDRGAFAQAQKDGAGIGAEFQRLVDRQQRAGAAGILLHHQRVAMHHIGAGVAVAFQRQQFRIVGAQMRGTIEHMGDEGRLAQRKQSNALMSSTKPDFAAKRADEILDFFGVMRQRRHHAPDRPRPGGIAGAARDNMNMQLRHQIAQRCDIQLVAFGDFFQRAGDAA